MEASVAHMIMQRPVHTHTDPSHAFSSVWLDVGLVFYVVCDGLNLSTPHPSI